MKKLFVILLALSALVAFKSTAQGDGGQIERIILSDIIFPPIDGPRTEGWVDTETSQIILMVAPDVGLADVVITNEFGAVCHKTKINTQDDVHLITANLSSGHYIIQVEGQEYLSVGDFSIDKDDMGF